jgi:hypothetical protein
MDEADEPQARQRGRRARDARAARRRPGPRGARRARAGPWRSPSRRPRARASPAARRAGRPGAVEALDRAHHLDLARPDPRGSRRRDPPSRCGRGPRTSRARLGGSGSPRRSSPGIPTRRTSRPTRSIAGGPSGRSATPQTSLGTPSSSRRTMCGGVRMARRTGRAPPAARSAAMSSPELPPPTTSASRPVHPSGDPYAAACSSVPANPSRPGHGGTWGSALGPVATTTARAASEPDAVASAKLPSARRSTRRTSTPSRTSRRRPAAYASPWAT